MKNEIEDLREMKVRSAKLDAQRWRWLPWGIAALGALTAILSLFRSLEYDEAWTLLYYVPLTPGRIFGDLATPNNHPLSTILIKLFTGSIGETPPVLRLASLLAYLGTMGFGVRFLQKNCVHFGAVLCGAAALAGSGILLHYGGTARGYALQGFGILLAAMSLREMGAEDKNRRAASGLLAGALMALFAVTSGVLLITALALAGLGAYLLPISHFHKWFKAHRNLWLCGAVFAAAALTWLLPHWNALQEARKFGVPLSGLGAYLSWAGATLWNLRIVPWLMLALLATWKGEGKVRRDGAFAVLFALFAFGVSAATNAGPERVYAPLVPVVIVWSTAAFAPLAEKAAMRGIVALALAAALTAVFANDDVARLGGPDWGVVASEAMKFPDGVLPLYRPGDSFPVLYNCPDAAQDYARRLQAGALTHLVALNPPDGMLESIDAKQNPQAFVPSAHSAAAGKIDCADLVAYELRPLTAESQVQGKTLLLQIPSLTSAQIERFFNHSAIADERVEFLKCNLFLTRQTGAQVWLLPAAKHSAEDYGNAARQFGRSVLFYEVVTPRENIQILK